jgi:hypothetical protein
MSFVLDNGAESPAQSARFVAHQQSAKYGRAWGKYNPMHLPIVQGVADIELELAKPNFGCRQLLRASKMDIAKVCIEFVSLPPPLHRERETHT